MRVRLLVKPYMKLRQVLSTPVSQTLTPETIIDASTEHHLRTTIHKHHTYNGNQ